MYKKELKIVAFKLSLFVTACLFMLGTEAQAQGRFKKSLSGNWRLIGSSEVVAQSNTKQSYLHIGEKNFVAYQGLCENYTGRINHTQSDDKKSNRKRVVYFKLNALKNPDDVFTCAGLDNFEAMKDDGFYAKITKSLGKGKPATLTLISIKSKKSDRQILIFQKQDE
jgi:hypothetical protein